MPLTRRQIYFRRRMAVLGGGLVALGTAFYLPVTLLAPVQEVSAQVAPYDAPAPALTAVTFPAYGASAIGAIGYPGVLAAGGSVEALPIASISKIITALVVLDSKPLAVNEPGPDITFTDADVRFYDAQVAQNGSVAAVYAGQVMSQRDAMNVMLIASANNYAESLASWAFGSQEAFVQAAAGWIATMGLASTAIVEPTGVSPDNVSTAADLVELARVALANPVLAEIVSTATISVPELGVIDNTNVLIGINGVNGIKTGTLDEAGSCLLFSQDHAVGDTTVTLIGVVLGGPDHDTVDAAIQSLLAEADTGFREVTLATEGQQFASYDTTWGDAAAAVAASTLSIVVWAATPISVSVKPDAVRLADAGAAVGTLEFTVGERTLEVPLELTSTIDDPGPWWRLTHPLEVF
ncbi:D-alanyl-D-alanine carboxypeptidase [Salinibacterium sp.]|uniref:D-alanyl-D-alanine carboxypeptidase family protein n=1 Tax=Salinibacterium sp. TaxID=1915057 RepID=UPI00286C3D28|nr:D-alanyl-D-alanine carboxypeptidase [Salinibacterium sp.]